LIPSINCVCSITIFSSSILFYNVNNNFWNFHKLQIYLNSCIPFAKQWSYVEFTLFCNGFTLKTTYVPWDNVFKWFLSLKLNKNPKYEKKKFFKVCHIQISQNCKVSNYTLGILGKPSMQGVHTLALWHFTRRKIVICNKEKHLQLYWQFLVAKIGYIYKNFSSSVWNHVTQVIKYWTFFQWQLN